MMRVGVVALVLAMATGTRVAAQEPQPDRTLPAQLSASTRATLERLIDSARVAGLPVDPLYSKVREGVFRSADDARVIAASCSMCHARPVLVFPDAWRARLMQRVSIVMIAACSVVSSLRTDSFDSVLTMARLVSAGVGCSSSFRSCASRSRSNSPGESDPAAAESASGEISMSSSSLRMSSVSAPLMCASF